MIYRPTSRLKFLELRPKLRFFENVPVHQGLGNLTPKKVQFQPRTGNGQIPVWIEQLSGNPEPDFPVHAFSPYSFTVVGQHRLAIYRHRL